MEPVEVVAVTVVGPVPTAVAKPCDPAAFEIVATDVEEDDHVTESVRFWVDASE
jgi:hypothetical protein